jgi:hypothetical protein
MDDNPLAAYPIIHKGDTGLAYKISPMYRESQVVE